MPLRTDNGITRRFEHELLAKGLTFAEFAERHGLPEGWPGRLARGKVSLRHELLPAFRAALRAEGIDPARGLERVRRSPADLGARGALVKVRYHGRRKACLVKQRVGLSYSGLARLVHIPRSTVVHLFDGYTLSHKRKSSRTAADERKARIATALRAAGATEEEVETLWEPIGTIPEADDDDSLPEELRRFLKGARPMLGEETLDRFGLAEDPFPRWTREGEDLFDGRCQKRALKKLRRAVDRQELVAVVGPVGSGKSELWKYFRRERELDQPSRYRFAELHTLSQARVTEQQLAEVLLDEVWGRPCPSKRQVRDRELRRHLQKEHDQGRVVVLVVEEGHLLSDEALRVLKSLDEITDTWAKLLGIVLLAQMQLHRSLKSQDLEEVRRRLPVIEYPGLHHTEIGRYLEHKLGYVRKPGARARVFEPGAVRVLGLKNYRAVTTTPLGLGNVAARSLEIACRVGRKAVTAADVERALLEGDRA